MNKQYLILSMIIIASMTYLPRVLPFLIFQKKIKNPFIRSFLSYMPYGMLSAMIFPAIFTSTGSFTSAVIGLLVACFLAYKKMGLLPVACGAVFAVSLCTMLHI